MSLADLLERVERGHRLPPDPWWSLLPAPSPRTAAVLAFPGHIAIAADLDQEWVRARLPDGDLSAPLNPPYRGRGLGRALAGAARQPVPDGPPWTAR